MRRLTVPFPRRPASVALTLWLSAACSGASADLLILGGTVFDGTGEAPVLSDVAVTGDQITFVGDAVAAGMEARDTVSALGLWVTPGLIDMHSHAELAEPWGRDGAPFVYQGITTAVLGVDGGGEPEIADQFVAFADSGVGLNAVLYVGHGAVRRRVLGMEDRAPTEAELDEMRALVRRGMEEGAFGLSSGLFYTPGYYADTEEVIELAKVAAEYGGIYDTHDRDLGASYEGVGYLASIEEGIRIGEEGGTRVIFSHFNAQGAANYGRASEGAALIEAARERGVDVQAAQHVYTATQSNLRAYAIPRWAAAGGDAVMLARFEKADTVALLDVQTMEMLEIRGGADSIYFSDPRPHLNGKNLAQVAQEWDLPVPAAVRRILAEGNAAVQNRGLYDPENTRYLALQPWMMTCTDGRTPSPETVITHPRPFGAFTKKLKDYVLDEGFLAPEFAIRSMTGMAADFLGLPDRGYLRPGMKADVAVLDPQQVQDRATYEEPQLLAEGTVHVLVNGIFELRDGSLTGELAGQAIPRPPVP